MVEDLVAVIQFPITARGGRGFVFGSLHPGATSPSIDLRPRIAQGLHGPTRDAEKGSISACVAHAVAEFTEITRCG